jgi:hypothetical protein
MCYAIVTDPGDVWFTTVMTVKWFATNSIKWGEIHRRDGRSAVLTIAIKAEKRGVLVQVRYASLSAGRPEVGCTINRNNGQTGREIEVQIGGCWRTDPSQATQKRHHHGVDVHPAKPTACQQKLVAKAGL